jgi:integrase
MSSYLLKLQENYYFRLWIPQDLKQHFPYQEIKRSLRTKCPKQARSQARLWSSKAERVFMMLRANILDPEQVQTFIQREIPSIWKRTHLEAVPGSHHVKHHELHKNSKQLVQVIEAYMQENIALGKWSEKTVIEARAQLSMFQQVVGNVSVKNINRQMMIDYLETLKRLPGGIATKPAYRGKTIQQILTMPDVTPMSNSTVNKYLERAGALLIWCMKQEHIDKNPAKGLSIAKAVKDDELRSAYSEDDLVRIVQSVEAFRASKPERYWMPLIGMYSGMRLNEICQLYVEDVQEVEGVWCFDINDEKDKRVKNAASKRMVPIHPKLVELGLVKYCLQQKKAGVGRLWMNLYHTRDGHSHAFSHWYQRHNRKHVTTDPLKVFHSFRHTVANTLKQAGVAEGVIAEILGHANHSITTGRYGKRYRPAVLLEALTRLDY